jgi:phosphoribosylformylglycinamidine synthase
MYEVTISVRLKEGITDPEGTTTLKSLHLLGFDQVKEIKTTKVFDLLLDEKDEKIAKKKAEEMCQKLLTNPVVHNYSIDIKKV